MRVRKQVRSVDRTDRFERHLRSLTRRKYPDLGETVRTFLEDCAENGVPDSSHKIPGVGNDSVFKSRLPLGNMGRRRGARTIYYCDKTRVVALFIYAKNQTSDIPVNEIRNALQDFGLLTSPGNSDSS